MPPTTAQALVSQTVSPSTLIDVAATYLRPEDIEQIEQAFALAARSHQGQYRKSGEPYITHPLSVATILAEWHLDPQALMAALLHDTVEDTSTTSVQIAQQFGKSVSDLVDGVSKLDRLEFQTEQQAQAENFRKMLLAMARDVRVILIKLADRLHNMRTLDAMEAGKQRRIARETLDIYSPIANRLGLHSVFQELQDLGFRYLFPNRYQVLTKAIRAARGNRREVVGKILTAINQRLTSFGVEAQVSGREKHLSSIYNKMLDKSLSFSQVLDIYGFRILVKDVAACYLALGALHTLYKPIPGKFKDYIAIPKANGYQSLHTTLFGPFGTPIEIQIRTHEMHKIAEAGVASHWLYKSSDTPLSDVQQKTHQWLQSLLEIQTESGDAVEFLEHLKVDLFPDEVYVFTPKGNIKSLPKGSTPVDFAYDVHTDIGNRCVAAKINNELAPLRTVLSNGDRVEIITEENAAPNPAWLNYVATAKARSKIRHYLRTMLRDESVALGERLLNQALRALKVNPADIGESQWEQLLKGDRCKTREEVLAEIGLGRRLNIVVARGLLPRSDLQSQDGQGSITIRGSEGIAVQFAHCCRPIPGDPIIGIIRKGQGLLIHTQDCRAIRQFRSDPDKWVDVEWENDSGKLFDVAIKLMVVNRRGVLATVASAIADAQSNIDSVSITKPDGTYTEINFTVQVRDRSHLANLLHHLREIPEVVRITRVQS
ncbi:MAG: bifunctional (p)ppGpp synthetase/guanosine-3',5'-bis(diphosphate) 3'-pyrophosphohydrolase [Betaproteobacteria bacterium]|nr:bifunctional (p)ppGpp synthetase/guanosine-3',5'-bis(diphosphate) 3'-pyrophosphohydrolase [Betaproteobacteria bacterium]MDE2621766.1 bifunctional (p)ppGpp synthetase/guanosine-3',5'-bis(diphosphate) 3'-pyrophosphohydrolase [Betaproteobacteria bacterium]